MVGMIERKKTDQGGRSGRRGENRDQGKREEGKVVLRKEDAGKNAILRGHEKEEDKEEKQNKVRLDPDSRSRAEELLAGSEGGPGGGPGGPGGPAINLGVDLSSWDEVKVWTEEGEEESEMTCSERLQAELQEDPGPNLIPLDPPDPASSPPLDLPGKLDPDGPPFTPPGYIGLSPYPYHSTPLGRGGSPLSFFYPEHLGSPPPAHMGGIPYSLDPHKGPVGFRGYPFSSQYSPYPDLTSWSDSMLTSSLHQSFPFPGVSLASAISRFSASGLFTSPGFGSSPLSPPSGLPLLNQVKLEPGLKSGMKKPHIKKPLNAFMLYMKEMRPKVVAECTLKESAAINQILGRKWHALTREEQAKYYEQARKERQLHMQMYPGWSARDNYAQSKEPKKKRKRDKIADNSGIPMKKCRARYGLDQNELWCKPCKPEEAIDGVDDNMPMFSMSGHGNMGDITQSPPHNLVSISEPLLDLRNYSQMSCSLIGTGLGSSCSGGHESADLSGLGSDPTGQSPKYICL